MCKCRCRCHSYSPWSVTPAAVPSIDAVTACQLCVDQHCAVLSERRIWFDPPPEPVLYVDPPRPAEFCNPEE